MPLHPREFWEAGKGREGVQAVEASLGVSHTLSTCLRLLDWIRRAEPCWFSGGSEGRTKRAALQLEQLREAGRRCSRWVGEFEGSLAPRLHLFACGTSIGGMQFGG